MQEATFKIRREYTVLIPIKVGDEIKYEVHGYSQNEEGIITHIFDGGSQVIVNDRQRVNSNMIQFINGKHVRYIKGETILT